MSDFEFTFALFGLLLGLSLAEVLGGLARALEARLRIGKAFRIGWLTPLLGAFVVLDLLSFWQAAWVSRDVIDVTGFVLMAVTVFAGSYYLASSLVFPRSLEDAVDLDVHFFRVRRIVIGVMLALLLVQLAFYASVPELAVRLRAALPIALTALLLCLMTIAMFVRDPFWARLAMAALVARYVLAYIL
ncbi:hypothetical protein [Brevundimonas viscosa]|uniref:Uncharacterized protein n=1 Tax=Brevundimonas viscosa TaxID=871741 RepID=A0A1I6T633_9CAUL|nr:hypothetical protein [Brevundimonas viscosa]SFS84498.1 hypothetical protein SAMN05192570_2984 [Brevundimonas viscosa]